MERTVYVDASERVERLDERIEVILTANTLFRNKAD